MKALVTGASSGIGKEMCYYLGELGYDVILVARDKKNLEDVASKIKTNTRVIDLDLSKRENAFKLYEMTKDENIDLLVNGAGFGLFGKTWETDLDRELSMIDLNVTSLHILTKLFLQDMVKRNNGRILNIASSAGFLAGPILNTYYSTKNYVLRFTEAIYEELRHDNINVHVSALCPGPVDTNFNKVAGGSFATKALDATYVARYGIDKCLKNKLVIVPGFGMKLVIFFQRFAPLKLLLRMTYGVQKQKASKGGKNV